jgi:hypothetical protein
MSNYYTPRANETLADDLLWGGAAIAAELGIPLPKFYYLFEIGALKNAVWKLSPKQLVGSRSRLRSLPELLAETPSN